MKSVGIRELKNRLSHYLQEVRRGRILQITDRGAVVAELRPPQRPDAEAPVDWEALARLGVRIPGRQWDPSLYRREPGWSVPPGTVKKLIDDERGDR